jgi:hypothetical protein
VRRAHPPTNISLDGLAITMHRSSPQAPGYTDERGDIFPEPGAIGGGGLAGGGGSPLSHLAQHAGVGTKNPMGHRPHGTWINLVLTAISSAWTR